MNNPMSAQVIAVQDDLVVLESVGDTPIVKNEVVYVCPRPHGDDMQERLKAEVLRVSDNTAVAQVFEDTRGICIGDAVEQSGQMLSATLGPGLLGLLLVMGAETDQEFFYYAF